MLNSAQSLSHVLFFATSWTTARQASLSITNSRSLLKLMSIESVMPSNHLILCHPLLLPPSIFPSIRVFSNELVLVWPQVNNREGTQLHPSSKNWIKDLLSMTLPISTRPSLPLSQFLPSGSFHNLLSFSIRGQTEWKPQSQKTNQSDHIDHSLV